jgi:hypothetical protein
MMGELIYNNATTQGQKQPVPASQITHAEAGMLMSRPAAEAEEDDEDDEEIELFNVNNPFVL